MQSLSTPMKSLILSLNEKGVEYLLVGGHAVRYYGYLRDTHDLDLWVPDDSPANASTIGEVLRDYFEEFPASIVAALSQPNRILEVIIRPVRMEVKAPIIGSRPAVVESFMGKQPQHVEFLNIQSGLNFHLAYRSRVTGIIEGIPLQIASLEDVKTIKKNGGRPKDLLDLAHLPD